MTQRQEGGDGSTNVQANVVNVHHHGLTLDEVRQVADDIFHRNFPRLAAEAMRVAEERLHRFRDEILRDVARLEPEVLAAFGDPDVQCAMTIVLREGVRTPDQSLRDRLAALLLRRIRVGDDEAERVVLNQAIEVTPKVTPAQLNVLALASVFSGEHDFRLRSEQDVRGFFASRIGPLTHIGGRRSDVAHLMSLGCVVRAPSGRFRPWFSVDPWSPELVAAFVGAFGGACQAPFTEAFVDRHVGEGFCQTPLAPVLLTCVSEAPRHFIFNAQHGGDLAGRAVVDGFDPTDPHLPDRVVHCYHQVVTYERVSRCLAGCGEMIAVQDIWEQTRFTELDLTPVGSVIGRLHLEQTRR